MSHQTINISSDHADVNDWVPIKAATELTGRSKSTINLWITKGILETKPAVDGTRLVSIHAVRSAAEAHTPRPRKAAANVVTDGQEAPSSDGSSVAGPTGDSLGHPTGDSLAGATGSGLEGIPDEERQEDLSATSESPGNSPTAPTEERADLQLVAWEEGTQVRARIMQKVVVEYSEKMKSGERFPPVDLFRGDDGILFIGDGWHRLLAAKKNAYQHFPARVYVGGRAAAIRHALKANLMHGLRLTQADRRKKVLVALNEFSGLSNNQIADACAVSEALVRRIRSTFVKDEPGKRLGADGKEYPAHKPQGAGRNRKTRKQLFRRTEKLAKQLTVEELERLRAVIEERIQILSSKDDQAPQ